MTNATDKDFAMQLQNIVSIITGGASGIGRATAERLHAAGARVVLFDMSEELGAALAAERGERALFAKVNVTDEASVQAGIALAIERFGAIHACVNCAGIGNAIKTWGKNGAFP